MIDIVGVLAWITAESTSADKMAFEAAVILSSTLISGVTFSNPLAAKVSIFDPDKKASLRGAVSASCLDF